MHAARREKLLAAQYLLGRPEKGSQEIEFAGRQRHSISGRRRQPARAHVELPTGEAVANALLIPAPSKVRRLGSPQHGPHPGEEFAQAEWFDHVVVGAEFEADDAIRFLTSMPGDKDNGHVRTAAEAAQEVQAVFVGQLQIKDDQIDRRVGQDPSHPATIGDRADLEILAFQIASNHLAHGRVVVDHEYMPHRIVRPTVSLTCKKPAPWQSAGCSKIPQQLETRATAISSLSIPWNLPLTMHSPRNRRRRAGHGRGDRVMRAVTGTYAENAGRTVVRLPPWFML